MRSGLRAEDAVNGEGKGKKKDELEDSCKSGNHPSPREPF
jgi:hypothetical protein